MYFDSDTKLVISGVIILLAGIVIGRRRGLLAGPLFSILFIIIFLILLVVGLVLYLGRPPVVFFIMFFLFLLYVLPGLFLLRSN